jgi:hypothetical protein
MNDRRRLKKEGRKEGRKKGRKERKKEGGKERRGEGGKKEIKQKRNKKYNLLSNIFSFPFYISF